MCDESLFSEPSPGWWLPLGEEDTSLSESLGLVSDGTVSVGSPGATLGWSVVVGGVVYPQDHSLRRFSPTSSCRVWWYLSWQ